MGDRCLGDLLENRRREPKATRTVGADPAWSPDGSRIAAGRYISDLSGMNLYLMNRDGSNAHGITTQADSRSVDYINWVALP
jgi:Tol biopolymer transport system component